MWEYLRNPYQSIILIIFAHEIIIVVGHDGVLNPSGNILYSLARTTEKKRIREEFYFREKNAATNKSRIKLTDSSCCQKLGDVIVLQRVSHAGGV